MNTKKTDGPISDADFLKRLDKNNTSEEMFKELIGARRFADIRLVKRAAIGLALACLISMPAMAHSWYTGLKAPSGNICCGGSDCGPVSPGLVRRNPDDTYSIWHGGTWYPVTEDTIMSVASPDQRVHMCFWAGKPQCVFLPEGG